MVKAFVLASAIAYLLGSIPFGLLLVRVFRGIDVRQTGSGNIGTANVARIAPGLGLGTLVLDSSSSSASAGIELSIQRVPQRLVGMVFHSLRHAMHPSRRARCRQ